MPTFVTVQQVCCPTTRVCSVARRRTCPTLAAVTGSTTARHPSATPGRWLQTWRGGTSWRRSAPTPACSPWLPTPVSTTARWTAACAGSSSIHVSWSSAFHLIKAPNAHNVWLHESQFWNTQYVFNIPIVINYTSSQNETSAALIDTRNVSYVDLFFSMSYCLLGRWVPSAAVSQRPLPAV